MMELNRISSHLVALATGGMELGALTAMTIGFRERELVLDIFEMITGLRMNHAYIRPGGVAQDLPEDGAGEDPRRRSTLLRKRLDGLRRPARRQPASGRPAPRASATSTSPAAWRSASPARCCAPPACRTTCARSQPYCGYETYDFDVPTDDTCDAYGRFLIRLEEMQRVAADRRAVPRPARARAR